MDRAVIVRRLLVAGLSTAWAIGQGAAAAERSDLNAAGAAITSEAVRQHVVDLADDTFEGREAGSRGGRAAGVYIVKHLKEAGLTGGGPKGSFYQPFGAGYSNILGLLEGSDPELKQQVIVVSAHYDHVGYGNRRNSYGPIGLIHNGADDNASGVAGLLKVVDAFSHLAQRPKRSILFAFFDGEEKGLLGSIHWVEQPTVPLARVPVAINADMIGRLQNDKLEIYGSRTTRGLRRLVSNQNDDLNLLIDFSWELKSNSDHYSFYQHRVPALLVHSGLHGDYHRPSDDADKINNEGLQRISQLLFRLTDELANVPSIDGFRDRAANESPAVQQTTEQPLGLPGSRLGVRWDPQSKPGDGVVIVSVEAGGPAARGGLKVGDRIVQFAGVDVPSPENFRAVVLAAHSPVEVHVNRAGGEKPVELELTLPGTPSRLGITWRTDDAEPGAVILNRVLPGSPADQAGLRTNDRVYQIDGHDFKNAEEFRQLATSLAGPIELMVESRGRIRRATLHPAELPEPAVAEASSTGSGTAEPAAAQ